MKTLLKQKVNADQTSQPNGLNSGNNRVTRQTVGNLKLELVDANRKIPSAPVEMEMPAQKVQTSQPVQGVKRAYATSFPTVPPMYASSVSVQQTTSREDIEEESFESSSAASYTQPAKKGAGSSVLRNTLSTPRDDNARIKNRPGRKPTKSVENMTDEEFRRLEDRRQKNKEAAQRCRSRRMGKIQELEERIKVLNGEINTLKTCHEKYRPVPEQLQYFLASTSHVCCLASTPPARPIQISIATISDAAPLNKPSSSNVIKSEPSSSKVQNSAKAINSPTLANRPGIKRPDFLNRPLNNIIAEQRRPASQPSPSVTLAMPSFGITPAHPEFFPSPWPNGTPGLPSFGHNGEVSFNNMMEDKTPSRDLALLALDLQTPYNYSLETPNTETPRLTAL